MTDYDDEDDVEMKAGKSSDKAKLLAAKAKSKKKTVDNSEDDESEYDEHDKGKETDDEKENTISDEDSENEKSDEDDEELELTDDGDDGKDLTDAEKKEKKEKKMVAIAAAKELKKKKQEEKAKLKAEKEAIKAKKKAQQDELKAAQAKKKAEQDDLKAKKKADAAKASATVTNVDETKKDTKKADRTKTPSQDKSKKRRRHRGYSSEEEDSEGEYYENWNPDADENPEIVVAKVDLHNKASEQSNSRIEAVDGKKSKEKSKNKVKPNKNKQNEKDVKKFLLHVPSDEGEDNDDDDDYEDGENDVDDNDVDHDGKGTVRNADIGGRDEHEDDSDKGDTNVTNNNKSHDIDGVVANKTLNAKPNRSYNDAKRNRNESSESRIEVSSGRQRSKSNGENNSAKAMANGSSGKKMDTRNSRNEDISDRDYNTKRGKSNVKPKKVGFFSGLFNGNNNKNANKGNKSNITGTSNKDVQPPKKDQSKDPVMSIYNEKDKNSLFYKDPKKKTDYGDWGEENTNSSGKSEPVNPNLNQNVSRVPGLFRSRNEPSSIKTYQNQPLMNTNAEYQIAGNALLKDGVSTPTGYNRKTNGTLQRQPGNMNPITPLGFMKNTDGTIQRDASKQTAIFPGAGNYPQNNIAKSHGQYHNNIRDPVLAGQAMDNTSGVPAFNGQSTGTNIRDPVGDSTSGPVTKGQAVDNNTGDTAFNGQTMDNNTRGPLFNGQTMGNNARDPVFNAQGMGNTTTDPVFTGLPFHQNNPNVNQNGIQGNTNNANNAPDERAKFNTLFKTNAKRQQTTNKRSGKPVDQTTKSRRNGDCNDLFSNANTSNAYPHDSYSNGKGYGHNNDTQQSGNTGPQRSNKTSNAKGIGGHDQGRGFPNADTIGTGGLENRPVGLNGSGHNPHSNGPTGSGQNNHNSALYADKNNPNSVPYGGQNYPNIAPYGGQNNPKNAPYGGENNPNNIPYGGQTDPNNAAYGNTGSQHGYGTYPNGPPGNVNGGNGGQGQPNGTQGAPFGEEGINPQRGTESGRHSQRNKPNGNATNPNLNPNANSPGAVGGQRGNTAGFGYPTADQSAGGRQPHHKGNHSNNPGSPYPGASKLPISNKNLPINVNPLHAANPDSDPSSNGLSGGTNTPVYPGTARDPKGRKLLSFRDNDPRSQQIDPNNPNIEKKGKQNSASDNDNNDIDSFNADGGPLPLRKVPPGHVTQKPAWQKEAPGEKGSNRRGVKTPVKELNRQPLTEPEPVFDTGRLGKRFPFLNGNKDKRASQDESFANPQNPMRRNQSDSDLVTNGNSVSKANPALNKFFPPLPNTLSKEDKKLAEKMMDINPEMQSKIFYGFGVGKWRLMAAKWLNMWKMKKKPVKTESSTWD
ncbi:uncharacterized protein DDB_G0287625-like [Mya arenaria]|uniref:uncharacterized protein DDB_G0287625-like n=1 Tax=Mya arenaria TaxID=6604 RepID=UPI0022E0ED74|nr:uncharacterized protein DDB_G0287625-like [Mya arenaria]